MAIIRTTGFVPLRRGLFEHVANGDMAPLECFLYSAILASADPATGMWSSSAGVLSSLFNIPHRTCRDLMEKLEKSGYVKRFPVQGKHGSYPILVHLFECSDGAMKGRRLNAKESTDYLNPIYFSRHEDGSDGVNERVNDGVNESATKNIDKQRTRQTEKKTKVVEVPDWVPRDSWDRYVEHRKAKGKFTQGAFELTIRDLGKLRTQGYAPGEVLDQSVQKGWAGVFPISKNGGNNGHGRSTTGERNAQATIDGLLITTLKPDPRGELPTGSDCICPSISSPNIGGVDPGRTIESNYRSAPRSPAHPKPASYTQLGAGDK